MIAAKRHGLHLLDVGAVAIAVATFLQKGEPDLLFHAIWVVLVIEAFAYGLRVSAPRIALAATLVIVYSFLEESSGVRPLEIADLMFTEWPLMFVIIVIVAIMADRVTTASRDMASLEQRTHDELLTAREDERRRLSADLHDGLGQTLTALVLHLDAAEAAHGREPASGEAVRRAQEIAAIALEETHEAARRLRPARMEEIGLANAIRELAANAGRPVTVDFDPRVVTPGLLPVDVEMQAYRIAQEAVSNAIRHASAESITIGLHLVRGGRLQVDVADDGEGFDGRRPTGPGLGLPGMQERAAAIGGTLAIETAIGQGTKVRLQLPLPPQSASRRSEAGDRPPASFETAVKSARGA